MIRLSQDRSKSMLAIHGWSGVLFGLLLYAVIVTGMISVFADEIGEWSNPRPHHQVKAFPTGSIPRCARSRRPSTRNTTKSHTFSARGRPDPRILPLSRDA